MAFCAMCGMSIPDGVAYCPQCGAATGPVTARTPAPAAAPPAAPLVAPATSGLTQNVAGLLCYLGFWVTGIIFLLIDKRPFVRFHAAQSIVVFGGLTVIRILLSIVLSASLALWGLWSLLFTVLYLLGLILWIYLMVTAYQGRTVEIPLAAGIAKNIAGNPSL
jgi:uncharacterized membrane protein